MNNLPYRWARRVAIAIVGGSVVLVGVAMIVLPGPAFIVIPAGLGILGLEFAWARLWLKKLKAAGHHVIHSMSSSAGKHTTAAPLADNPAKPNKPDLK